MIILGKVTKFGGNRPKTKKVINRQTKFTWKTPPPPPSANRGKWDAVIFSFIDSFLSLSEENKFENVSAASKTARFLAFFNTNNSVFFFLFRSLRLLSFALLFDVSFLHFQRFPDKTFFSVAHEHALSR